MQQITRESFQNCIIIVVAHRLETIMDCDHVAMMSEGELVEYDAPQELLAKASIFRNMYED